MVSALSAGDPAIPEGSRSCWVLVLQSSEVSVPQNAEEPPPDFGKVRARPGVNGGSDCVQLAARP